MSGQSAGAGLYKSPPSLAPFYSFGQGLGKHGTRGGFGRKGGFGPVGQQQRGANGSRECAPDDRLRDEAIHASSRRNGLLRFARNDGANNGACLLDLLVRRGEIGQRRRQSLGGLLDGALRIRMRIEI